MKTVRQKGITLLEALVTVLIGTAILAAVYSTFMLGNRTWAYYSNNIAVKQEVRRAFYVLTNELREANNIFIVKEPDAIEMSFYRPGYGSISYSWKSSGGEAKKIIRKSSEGKRTLANQISSLSFIQPATDRIFIEVVAGKDYDVRLSETVALRAKTKMIKKVGKSRE